MPDTDHPLHAVPRASKVFAVHVNYRSRAAERGVFPEAPSYFLKPPSAIAWGSGSIVLPPGAELLVYEGEVAVIIGRRTFDVSPEEAWGSIGWYAAGNDVGLHDFRTTDRGSNVLSKGQDGFAPLGTPLVAPGVDPGALALETRVNGTLVQSATTEEQIFSFATLVADLARTITLEPGDVILAGTPTGTSVICPGDVVEVTLTMGEARSVATSTVVRGTRPLRPYGAMPQQTAADVAFAHGTDVRPA